MGSGPLHSTTVATRNSVLAFALLQGSGVQAGLFFCHRPADWAPPGSSNVPLVLADCTDPGGRSLLPPCAVFILKLSGAGIRIQPSSKAGLSLCSVYGPVSGPLPGMLAGEVPALTRAGGGCLPFQAALETLSSASAFGSVAGRGALGMPRTGTTTVGPPCRCK